MNRYEKLEWLEQTCSEKFMKEEFVLAMVSWMGEDEFEAFYDHLCRNWAIAGSPEALEELDPPMSGAVKWYCLKAIEEVSASSAGTSPLGGHS